MQEKKRYTLPEYPPADQAKATRPPIKADEAVLLGEATPQAIGRELARRGRDATLLALRVASLEARPEPEPQPAAGIENEVVAFIAGAGRWLTLTEIRRRFQGPKYRGDKLLDAINSGGGRRIRGIRRKTRAGRVEQLIGSEWLDNPKD